jgi:prevent-host-death family protein
MDKRINPSKEDDYFSQMIQTTISDAKARLSHYIDLAKAGETVLITDRGVPVVKLESAARPSREGLSPEDAGRLYRLEKAGLIRMADKPMDLSWLEKPRAKPLPGGDILKALLDEREESR